MARYNEEARIFASLVKDKNTLKAQIAGTTKVLKILKGITVNLKVEVYNIVAKTKIVNGFILDHATLGILDSNYFLADTNSQVEVVRRKWLYNTQTQFETGTKSTNINLTDGDIRLAK